MILCISDLHLGSPICQASSTLEILEKVKYDKIIICGDLLDSYNIHRLCKKQWKVLSALRKISKRKECIFIKGNHDRGLDTISALLGFDFKLEHVEVIGSKKFYFVHGDKWDYIIQFRPLLTEIASGFYYFLQKLDKEQKYTRILKRKVKSWHNAAKKISERICKHALHHGYDTVVFGHTHIPLHDHVLGIEYVNLGSQCDLPVTYAVIDPKDGKIELRTWE
jgi:UDP-2,3-diacylglucosamine pyrophosphatase LpxH